MGDMFNADEGLIHFTFANEDTYVKKSLAVLNRQQNLYYELKQRYYNAVLFIDLKDTNYRITCADGEAERLYNTYKPLGKIAAFGAWMANKNSTVEYKSATHYIPRDQKETLLVLLDRMMSNSRETAYVFSMDAIASFQGITQAQRVLNKQRIENCANRNLLLIVSDTQLNASFDKLLNPDGIFQSDAFPQIREICQNYSNVRLYECMKKNMPGRVSYLNEMKWDELYHLVTWSVMRLGNQLSYRMNALYDYTYFIWLMTHSSKFFNQKKRQYPQLANVFTSNDARLFSVLKKNLSVDAAYEQMDLVIADIRKQEKEKALLSLVNVDDTSVEYQNYLYQSNPVLKRLNTLSLCMESKKYGTTTFEMVQEISQKLNRIRQELVKPHVISDKKNHEELQTFVSYCVDMVHTADGLNDFDTMKLGVDALVYAICKCEQEKMNNGQTDAKAEEASGGKCLQNNGQALCRKAYESALEFQNSIGEQKRKVQSYVLSLQNLTQQMEELQKKIEDMDKKFPGIDARAKMLDDHSALVEHYRSLKAEYVALEEEKKAISYNMKMIKLNLVEQKKAVAALRSEINSMEDTEYAMTYAQFDISIDFMYDMGEKVAKLRAANKNYFEKLHQKNHHMHHGYYDEEQVKTFCEENELMEEDLDSDEIVLSGITSEKIDLTEIELEDELDLLIP